jgi:hypothetical protein
MFGGFEDDGDPTSNDDGVFLGEDELYEWHRSMQVKYPQVYTEDDKMFGDHGHQHPVGTKVMAWFDDDPNKPMRMEIRGSRWVSEMDIGAMDKSPMYVVKPRDSIHLTQIPLTSAHEDGGWLVGWDLDPPEAN